MSRAAENDVVMRFIEIVAASLGGLEEQTAREIEEQIRREYGGDEPYIARARWTDISERDAAIRAALAAGRTERDVCMQFCVGKGTVHRIKQSA